MSRPLLCLTAIVKDEAHCIVKTLESVKPYIDCWAIVDTGSTDGTQDVVRQAMAGVPGTLSEAPFVDFSTARNQAIDLAMFNEEKPVFMLSLSADEVLTGGADLRAYLETRREGPGEAQPTEMTWGAYSVTMVAGNQRWAYPRVLRTDAGWRYIGEVHEVPFGPKDETHGPIVPNVYVEHTATDPARRMRRVKDFDIPILTKVVEDESRSLRDRAQAIWFLGQSYESLSEAAERTTGSAWITHKLAAMSYYWRRVEVGSAMGAEEDDLKTHYALFRYLNIADKVGFYTDEEILVRLDALSEMEPRIPEVFYLMSVHAAKVDVRQGLYFAEQAARAAKEALGGEVYHMPVDSRVEWLALAVGAACAKSLERLSYACELAERGIAAGGPREKFEEYLGLKDPPVPVSAEAKEFVGNEPVQAKEFVVSTDTSTLPEVKAGA